MTASSSWEFHAVSQIGSFPLWTRPSLNSHSRGAMPLTYSLYHPCPWSSITRIELGLWHRKMRLIYVRGLQRHDRVRGSTPGCPSGSIFKLEYVARADEPTFSETGRPLFLFVTTGETSLVLPKTFQAARFAPPLITRYRSSKTIDAALFHGRPLHSASHTFQTLAIFLPDTWSRTSKASPILKNFRLVLSSRYLPPAVRKNYYLLQKRLMFRGVGVYLDNLVAQINTPLLERLSLTLLFEIAFTLPNLTESIHRAEGLGCPGRK
jgi:hypothetical protein